MSRSARRLGSAAVTSAWPHQARDTSAPAVVAFFESDSGEAATAATRLTLPSVSGQKLVIAEREAHARGFEEGKRLATEFAGEQAQILVLQLTKALEDVSTLRKEVLHQTERELVRLATAMAERIVNQRVEDDRSVLIAMARAAIEGAGKPAEATVCLHPSDYELAIRHGVDTGADGVVVVADPAVPPGGCIVQSPFGVIDAGVSTQVKEMSRILLGDEPPAGSAPAASRQRPEGPSNDVDR